MQPEQDSPDRQTLPPARPQKRSHATPFKWGTLILLALFLTGVLLNLRWPPGPHQPAVTVSPETTFITGPLKPNGDVDYIAWLNATNSEGVSPDDNAFIDLLQVIGPRPEGAALGDLFYRLLGVSEPPLDGVYLREAAGWIDRRYDSLPSADSFRERHELDHEQVADLVRTVPFTVAEIPEAGKSLEQMEPLLEQARRGVRKSGWYLPYAWREEDSVFGILLPFHQQVRCVPRLLKVSCMRWLGKGEFDRAVDDAEAALRLSQHVGSQSFILEALIGAAIERDAIEMLQQIVFAENCPEAVLLRIDGLLRDSPLPFSLGPQLLTGERAGALDLAIGLARTGNFQLFNTVANYSPDSSSGTAPWAGLIRSAVDWDIVMRILNQGFEAQGRELVRLGNDPSLWPVAAKAANAPTPAAKDLKMSNLLTSGRVSRSKVLGEELSRGLMTFGTKLLPSHFRTVAERALLRVGIALVRYRRDRGSFPPNLTAVVPDFLDAIPGDPFSGQALVYKTAGDQFSLYSIGPNCVDDGGRDAGQDPVAFDLVVPPRLRTIQQWLDAQPK